MERKITIGKKEYLMKSSAYTPIAYKNETGRTLITDLTSLVKEYEKLELDKLSNEEILEKYDKVENVLNMTLKIAYIMSKEAKSITGGFDDFAMEIDNYLDDINWMLEVIELALSPLSGGIQISKIS